MSGVISDEYQAFLASKRVTDTPSGFAVPPSDINPTLFEFQRAVVQWALQRGRAAVFLGTGLGKTPIQLEWAKHVNAREGRPVLILAPLAVSRQTQREGNKFGVPVTVCRQQSDIQPGVNITNYEMLQHFTPDVLAGIVLDESSILKGFGGVLRKAITDFGSAIPYRLACTATPAPNDTIEILNHAEFLGIMSGKEMLALFFIQDGNTTHKWRLKGHAQGDFWRWLASWARAAQMPSDLGFDDGDFALPPLREHAVVVKGSAFATGALFAADSLTLAERRGARRGSLPARVRACADMVNADNDQWLVWCDLNAESAALADAIPGAVEVKGADTSEHKEKSAIGFSTGEVRVLISKPSIFGFGLNFQSCHKMAFVGLSDSWESLYQATRRCWRFGQTHPVDSYHITSDQEGAVKDNLARKNREATKLMQELVNHMNEAGQGMATREDMAYSENIAHGDNWTLYLGDSVLSIDNVPDNSIGVGVTSVPFPGMYAYTNSPHDMGNVKSLDEMVRQFAFLVAPGKMLRAFMPGRSFIIHLTQGVAFKGVDGYIGIKDFRGRVIQTMEDAGWIYYGEVCINKNPQVKAIRTKDRGLLFKTLATDASHLHMALADYMLQFRKPGDNPEPIKAGTSEKYGTTGGWITPEEWIEWAHPVWNDIKETDVLEYRCAKDSDDEKHLCPLQREPVRRWIKLASNPGDLVYDPFTGIGTVGYEALCLGRRFVGGELKQSYFNQAVRNLQRARPTAAMPLFAEPGQ